MGLLSKKPAAVEPNYRVPSLQEVDDEYGVLLERRSALQTTHARLQAEIRQCQDELGRQPAPAFKPEVAELLGEDAGSASTLRTQIREKTAQVAHHDAALQVIEDRLRQAVGAASLKVCEQVRPEYGRRVQQVCRALLALESAYAELDTLKNDLEREDVQWTRLTPMLPTFLGPLRDPDNRIARYLREAKDAGYWDVA
ncbi:MAG TPA: hypothetical protein VIL88_14815 [Devosia sp.]|jgi:chromosome segregation ATPase|uniref:hypothetical protein n=1 Tax=Devosia sp. TaxID=1871048 RepID=UPI002F925D72